MRIHSFYFSGIACSLIVFKGACSCVAQSLPQTEVAAPSIPINSCPTLTPNSLQPPNSLQRPAQPQEVEIHTVCALSIDQAILIALQNNPKYRIQILTLEKSKAALRQTQAALYPTVSLQGGLTRQETHYFTDQQSISSANNSSNTLSGKAVLSYDLYTSGQRSANIRAAKSQVDYDSLGVKALQETARLNISSYYYDLQNADAQVMIQQAAVANSQESLRVAEARENFGVGTRFDVLQARVQLANSTQNLTNALSTQTIARRQLAQLLNLTQTINLTASDTVQVVGVWPLNQEQTIVKAYSYRVELDQFLAQKEIGRQYRRAALAALGPTLSLNATPSLSGGLDSSTSLSAGYSIGANVTWTAFDGGGARANAARYAKDMQIAEENFADTRNQIRFDVEQAYSNSQANYKNIQTTTLAITEAQEALRLARLRFNAGVGTQTDVINAETNLTTAQGNRIQAIVNYNKAIAILIRNTGDLRVKP
jgi:outer membrane protein TolC